MSRPLLFVVLLTLAGSSEAVATSFDFVTAIDGAHPYSYEGRMNVSNTFSRVDVTRGGHPLFNPGYTIISQRSGQILLVLDHKQKTYFVRETAELSGPMSTVRGFSRTTASRASIQIRRERDSGPPIEGRRTSRYSIHITYDLTVAVEDETFSAKVDISGSFWTVDGPTQSALPWGLQFGVKTGFPEIDRAVARKIPRELPIRQLVTVSRRIGDGPAVTETMTTTASNISDEPPTPGLFGAPADYRMQEPEFTFGAP